jgi:hypothetical protein
VREGVAPPEFATNRMIEAAVVLPWLGSIFFFFILRREKAVAPGAEPS